MTTEFTKEQLIEHLEMRLTHTSNAVEENAGTGWAEFYEKEVAVLQFALVALLAEPEKATTPPVMASECEICGKPCSDLNHPQRAVPAKGDETRQIPNLVMMVKLLARTVKKYNPNSQQAKDFTAYLEREGLISATDCLRDGAKAGE